MPSRPMPPKRSGRKPLPRPISLPPKRQSPPHSRTWPRLRNGGSRPPPGSLKWPQTQAAKADATAKADAAVKAADAAKAAVTRKTETAKAADEAKLALVPVSIYISRATQKLYVRRNTQKPWSDGGEVFDVTIEVPVTIRDPERPIGTHIFTAMAPATGACAGPRSRSTTGTSEERARPGQHPARRCSIASRRPRYRGPRSSSRTSR